MGNFFFCSKIFFYVLIFVSFVALTAAALASITPDKQAHNVTLGLKYQCAPCITTRAKVGIVTSLDLLTFP